ncbi:esterase [Streptomyces filipinensis]|uniref:Esterase n=1 Tax=Streptomyces filipinensis TaxID=66887 RepID=A0A918MEQ2_9ACTN|nr:alpha/beta fold hydrolase [Streptomyces filipinensis]GGV14442.1 esterase [Streptomyces filipinensis]
MTDFILVPGAWLGAWAWDEVAADLRAAGHTVHALTLSGLAEKKHSPAGQQIHVQDIVEEVERRELRDVVLVGHSYSGVPVGQAAERIGDRLRRVVFVDSNLPEDGVSFLDGFPSDHIRAALDEREGVWPLLPAAAYAHQDLTDEQIARLIAEGTAHPAATLTEPAVLGRPLAELPATYVKCGLDGRDPLPAVTEALRGGRWELVELKTGHWPMFSTPRELARILDAAAARR